MRRSWLWLACLLSLVAAWSKDDQEIFRLRSELALSEGPDVTFYDFLGITPAASQEDIKKAYHKKSRLLHPDKIKQNLVANAKTHSQDKPSRSDIKTAQKDASDRYARLTIVVNILRGAGRERYDFFLSNGFPKWKGTGYYYARFRPGIGSVLMSLFICVGGGGHWLALYLGWKRQKEFVGRYVKFARHAAWGEVGVPGVENFGGVGNASQVVGGTVGENLEPGQVVNRRQRRLQEKEGRKDKDKSRKRSKGASGTSTPVGERAVGAKKRVVAENGKILVVDSTGNVFLEQADDDGEMHEFLLDPNELPRPTIRDTALCRVPIWTYTRFIARYLPGGSKPAHTLDEKSDDTIDDQAASHDSASSDFEVLESVKTTAPNGVGKSSKKKVKGSKR